MWNLHMWMVRLWHTIIRYQDCSLCLIMIKAAQICYSCRFISEVGRLVSFVIRNAVYLMEKQYLFRVLNVLISAMENLHEKEKLEYMNHALTELSVRDTMTGLYNRLGYQQIACRYFEEKKKKKRIC